MELTSSPARSRTSSSRNASSVLTSPSPTPSPPVVHHPSNSKFYFFDWSLIKQSTPPLFLSLLGLLATGFLMDTIQHWDVFVNLSELFIVMPILLNLRGNMEMNLASRLSTMAHFDWFAIDEKRNRYLLYNVAVIQIQCLAVGTLSGLSAFLLGGLFHGSWNSFYETMLMITTSVITACVSSAFTGIVTIWSIIFSWKMKIDPDNIATPIAATLGDAVTLFFLAMFGQVFYKSHENPVITIIFLLLLGSGPFWYRIVYAAETDGFLILPPPESSIELVEDAASASLTMQNRPSPVHSAPTGGLLFEGWFPLLVAMLISGGAGVLQERFVQSYVTAALLLPVFNGVGQNISSIYVSRLSTFLHLKTGNHGTHGQEDSLFEELQETSSFTVSEEQQISNNHSNNRESAETRRLHNRIQRTLVFLTLPLQILMILAMWIFNLGHTKISIAFVSLYLSGSLLLSWLLIPISKVIVLNIWKRGMNPDNHALPYTSSICDLIGTALLLIIFIFVHAITHE